MSVGAVASKMSRLPRSNAFAIGVTFSCTTGFGASAATRSPDSNRIDHRTTTARTIVLLLMVCPPADQGSTNDRPPSNIVHATASLFLTSYCLCCDSARQWSKFEVRPDSMAEEEAHRQRGTGAATRALSVANSTPTAQARTALAASFKLRSRGSFCWGPLPPCAAGEGVWQARNAEHLAVFRDPCRLVRQVKQFEELDRRLSQPRPRDVEP